MAGNDPQKQFLSLIRDFASEKSHGERRIANLKKRIDELRSELSEVNAELEDAKVEKESTEQELKGYEVELAMTEASIQSLEARIAAVQDEVSALGSDLEALKSEGAAKRDDFIKKMQEFNACIRKFQESVAFVSDEDYNGARSRNGVCKITNANKTEVAIRDIENELSQTISQTNLVEQEYQTEQNIYKLVQQELSDLERKASLMEKIEKGNAELRELARYPSIHDFLQALCSLSIVFNELFEILKNGNHLGLFELYNLLSLFGFISHRAAGITNLEQNSNE